jgi:hypothetical protein
VLKWIPGYFDEPLALNGDAELAGDDGPAAGDGEDQE